MCKGILYGSTEGSVPDAPPLSPPQVPTTTTTTTTTTSPLLDLDISKINNPYFQMFDDRVIGIQREDPGEGETVLVTYYGKFSKGALNDPQGNIRWSHKTYIGPVVNGVPNVPNKDNGTTVYKLWYVKDSWKQFDITEPYMRKLEEVLDSIAPKLHPKIHQVDNILDIVKLPEDRLAYGRYLVEQSNTWSYYVGDLYFGRFNGLGKLVQQTSHTGVLHTKIGVFVNGQFVRGVQRDYQTLNGDSKINRTYVGNFNMGGLTDPNGHIRYHDLNLVYEGPTKRGIPETETVNGRAVVKGTCFVTQPTPLQFEGNTIRVPALEVFNRAPLEYKSDLECVETVTAVVQLYRTHDYQIQISKLTQIVFTDGCCFVGEAIIKNISQNRSMYNGSFKFPDSMESADSLMANWDNYQLYVYLSTSLGHLPDVFFQRVQSSKFTGFQFVSLVQNPNSNINQKAVLTELGLADEIHRLQVVQSINTIRWENNKGDNPYDSD